MTMDDFPSTPMRFSSHGLKIAKKQADRVWDAVKKLANFDAVFRSTPT